MSGKITVKFEADVNSALNGIQSVNQKLDQLTKTIQSSNSRFEQLSKNTQSVNSKLANLSKPLDGAKSKILSLSASFSALTTAAGIVVSMIQKLTQRVAELMSSYSIQEKAEMRLQSTLKATQNACGMTASEMIFAIWKNIFS